MEIKQSGDTVQYYKISQNLLAGNGFSLDGVNPSARRAPGYPLFIAGVYFLLPDHVISVYLLQIVFDVLTFLLFCNIISLLWKDEKITLIFAVLYATYYPLLIYSGSIISENLFMVIFSGFIYASVKNFKSPGMVISFVMGLALSAATLVRATPLFMLILMIPLFYMMKSDLKSRLLNFGLFLAGFFLLLAPWTMRNYVVFDAFLPVTVGTGVQLYDGTHAGYDGTTAARQSAFDEGIVSPGDSEVEKDRKLMKFAVERLKTQPISVTLTLFAKQLTRTWFNVPFAKQSFRTYMLFFWHILLLLFAGYGLWKSKPLRMEHIFLLLIPIYFTVVHMPFPSYVRYIIPIMPLIMIYSSKGFFDFVKKQTAGKAALN